MQALFFIANLAFTIVVTCIRFIHSGKVCSGDYRYDLTSDYERGKGQLVVEGFFLFIVVVAGWVIFAIMVIVLLVQICTTEGKYTPNRELQL